MVLDGVGLGEADFPFFEELPVFGLNIFYLELSTNMNFVNNETWSDCERKDSLSVKQILFCWSCLALK